MLPKSLNPLTAIVVALCGFGLLRALASVLGQLLNWEAGGTHVLTEILLLAISLATARLHPAGLSMLGARLPRGRAWPALILAGGILGGATSCTMLACGAGGHPLMRQLTLPEIVLSVWLLSSIAEEFYCRGLIQPWIDDQQQRAWTHPATITSAVIFGCMHLSLYFAGADLATIAIIVTATTLLGYVCAVARRMTDSLYPSILTHIAFNVGGVVGAVVLFMLR